MSDRENDKYEAKERINFITMMLQTAMKSSNTQIGFNLESKKLIVLDCITGYKGEIDLEELNRSIE